MRVLMLGWEFPPFISGGLGTACYGLTRAMSDDGVEIIFVLPRAVRTDRSTHVRLIAPAPARKESTSTTTTTSHSSSTERKSDVSQVPTFQIDEMEHVTFVPIAAAVTPYMSPDDQQAYEAELSRITSVQSSTEDVIEMREITHESSETTSRSSSHTAEGDAELSGQYGHNLMTEVHRYARLVMELAPKLDFDVIHAHDWMTFPAAMGVAAVTGKPLVVHVHSTEFDRSGERVNQHVYDIERAGMDTADAVIAVSNFTRKFCVSRYGQASEKVHVVYNAIDLNGGSAVREGPVEFLRDDRLVLFLGRLTMQKGPEYFVAAAKKVLEKIDNVKFVMAGSGDMFRRVIELAADLGIGHRILFTGFLRGDDVEKIFRMADLFVMPSVSEPFGLVPLEAMSHNVPVIISKQSGVSEVLTHALKVDFWDINEMANKIIAVLRHAPLQETLKQNAHFEIRKFSWGDTAAACEAVYDQVLAAR